MIDEIVRKATRAFAHECRRHAGALNDEAERLVAECQAGRCVLVEPSELVKALRAGAQALNAQAALAVEAEPHIIASTKQALL